tara:strand:- start:248 stop:598 length:351 start_codon:yes stop_codon:yes gene_type:complete
MAPQEKKTLVVAKVDFWLTEKENLPLQVYETEHTFRFNRDANYKFRVDISKSSDHIVNSIRPDLLGKTISVLNTKGLLEMAKTKNCFVDVNIDRYYKDDKLEFCDPVPYTFQIVFQ